CDPRQMLEPAFYCFDRIHICKITLHSPFDAMLALAANGRAGPVKGTFITSTPRNSPLRDLPSIEIESSIGFAVLTHFSNRARPLRRLSAPLPFSRLSAAYWIAVVLR